MARERAKKLVRQDAMAPTEELSDDELLEQFLNGEELESQDAFNALVARHGPMVLGTCRHVLGRDADAEDALQATFLALARKGGTIRDRRVLSGWLHEVAYRIAVKSRARAMRRRTLERRAWATLPPAIEPNHQDQQAAWNESRPVLHEEVKRLPDKYRLPVILSYLEGKTNEEVAELLQWPVGTVKTRLSHARDLLRSRLTRRGLALSVAFLVTALSHGTVFAEMGLEWQRIPLANSDQATSRTNGVVRVAACGPPPNQCEIRSTLIAPAVATCWRRALARPM